MDVVRYRKRRSPASAELLQGRERRGFLKPSRMYEVLTLPTVFPALGRDVNKACRTHPKDLLAQKVSSPPLRNPPRVSRHDAEFDLSSESRFRTLHRQRPTQWI